MAGPPTPGGAPPMGAPRPMGMQGPRNPAPQQMMAAGSGGSAESSQEVITALANLFNIYGQVEQNIKMKQETEIKYNLLKDRLQEGSVSPGVVSLLKQMTQAAEVNNFASALGLHKDLIQKNWQESKDWANALKVLISFKQRFQQ